MNARTCCRLVATSAVGLVLCGCGAWVPVPGGGQQTLRVKSVPEGAALVLELETEKRELGPAPADVVMTHGIDRFQSNPHCGWWPATSALVAGVGAVLLGTVGLGKCVDRAGTMTGSSEEACEDTWRPGALNAYGAGSTVGLV